MAVVSCRNCLVILPGCSYALRDLVTLCKLSLEPGAIARLVAMSLGNLEAPLSILASGTSFLEDLFMKLF